MVIQLPPWVVVLYPSSLIYHFNIDINGKLLPPSVSIEVLTFSRHEVCDHREWSTPYS